MEGSSPDQSRLERARRTRSIWIVCLLILSTSLGLVLAWAQPQGTLGHFWGVTQFLPVFYLGLSVWAAWPLPGEARE